MYGFNANFIWNAVVLFLIDGVAEELEAVLDRNVFHIDGVFGAISEFVFKYKDRVVVGIAQIERVGMNLSDVLSSIYCASAPDEGAEGDKRKDK